MFHMFPQATPQATAADLRSLLVHVSLLRGAPNPKHCWDPVPGPNPSVIDIWKIWKILE